MAYVVVATFKFGGAAVKTEVLGVYERQTWAWDELENFDFMKTFNRVMTGNLTQGHVTKNFSSDGNGVSWYTEQHYVNSDKEECGSVTLGIFEQEVE